MNKELIEERIAELERTIRARGGIVDSNPGIPPSLHLAFLEQVIRCDDEASDEAGAGIDMKAEVHAHLDLPPESEMDDHSLTAKLHELIELLARFHICLDFTDHLTDRELYRTLLGELLDDPYDVSTFGVGVICHSDVTHGDPDGFERFYGTHEPAKPANRSEWLTALAEKYRDEPVPEFKSPQARKVLGK